MARLLPLGGKKVLIVEDNFLIAQEMQALMRAAGCSTYYTAPTSRAALDRLDEERPDGVLLDVNLGDCDSSPVARALDACGVPFLLVTGYERERLPPALRDRPCLSKPFAADTLVAMAARTFAN